MKLFALRVDEESLKKAKRQAEQQGRPLSGVIRKMITDWISGRYKPFEDS